MEEMGLNDTNVEKSNFAFISIIGTEECIKHYIGEDDKHYFKDHANVLNLELDDCGEYDIMYNGHHFKTMTMEQAERTVSFIEDMVNNGIKTFYIHCKAGYSRSRAVGEFIYRYCKENDIDVEYADRLEYMTHLSDGVLRRLNHAYWKKHKLRHYEDETQDYPHDLIEPPIRIINTD
jgi:hypothetical protein